MPENTPAERPLSGDEVADFQLLGLTPGHWSVLSAVPLSCKELRPIERHEFKTLHALRQGLGSPPGLENEAEQFWLRVTQKGLGEHGPTAAYALLGWHLAIDLPRDRREAFLAQLDRAAEQFRRAGSDRTVRLPVVQNVRRWVDAYLSLAAYTRYPDPPRPSPPDPAEVAALLGPDLWKQMLTAPIAAALTEKNARAADVLPLVRRLAYVTDRASYGRPDPLEPHLTPGWLTLFGRLLEPARPASGPPLPDAVRVAARGLASLDFLEREQLLQAIAKEIRQGVFTADRERVADAWVDRVRELVDESLLELRSRAPVPVASPVPDVSAADPAGPPPATVPVAEAVPPAAALSAGPPEGRPSLAVSIPVKVSSPAPAAPPRPTAVTVQKADPFTFVSLDAAFDMARGVTVAQIRDWLNNPENARRMLFDDARLECPEAAIVRDPKAVPPVLWVVGDIHADVLTLANVIAHADRVAEAEGKPAAYLFLGDFLDRGRHDHETLLLLFRLIMRNPGRVCVIPGNHDIDLQWGEKLGRFGVTIEPAEYCAGLNKITRSDDPGDRDRVELAKILIPFWKDRPKAVFLPDGTLYAHAGFPHTDVQPDLRTPADLGNRKCVDDFLWARISETRRKRPNRGNRGHEFGWDDFAQFCKAAEKLGGLSVRRLVRGHDHVPARWRFYPEYAEFPVLTINAMGRLLDGEPPLADAPHPLPVMARHVPGELPVVVRLPLDPKEVDRAFGRERGKPAEQPPPEAPPAKDEGKPADPPAAGPNPTADDIDTAFNGLRVDADAPARPDRADAGPGGAL